jgi:hypothetical protein
MPCSLTGWCPLRRCRLIDRVLDEQFLHNAQVKGFAVHEAVVDKLPDPSGPGAWPVPVTG